MRYCSNCGAVMSDAARFCENCGKAADGTERRTEETYRNSSVPVYNGYQDYLSLGEVKNKWVALGLCLFFGVLGAHKFYERKYVWGVVYLFTGGLAGVGWLIDLVKILMIPETYYYVYR